MERPQPSEYEAYYGTYIGRVPEGNVLELLERGIAESRDLLGGIPPTWETYRYEPGKWSVREVVAHVIDAERVFGYRALSIARADPAPLPSMDQDLWAANAHAANRPLASLLDELEHLRRSHVAMFAGFDAEVWGRRGVASGFEFTVRTFPYILAGHEIHHRRVLEERYLRPLREGAGG
jgi:hypothetical protein